MEHAFPWEANGMRYLITGGAGFIGSHLAGRLVSDGHSVLVLDDLSTGSIGNLAALQRHRLLTFMPGRVQDRDLVEELVASVDRVFHLAASVGVMKVFRDPDEAFENNVSGARAVLDSAARFNRKVLLTSSSEVYGPDAEVPMKEDNAARLDYLTGRRWLYAASKLFNEIDALARRKRHGLPLVVARLFNTIGPAQSGDHGMVVPRFVRQAIRNEPVTVFGTGGQRRCFSWVGDVVATLVGLMDSRRAEGCLVNVGSEEEITIRDLAATVIELAGSRSPIRLIPYETAYGRGFVDTGRRVPDLSRLRRIMGGEVPRMPIRSMVARIVLAARCETSEQALSFQPQPVVLT